MLEGPGRVSRSAAPLTGGGVCVVLAGLLLGWAAGCGGGQKEGVARMDARPVPYLEGVAVPSGFSMVDRNTEDYSSGAGRWARHEYVGWADPEAVRQFYREQMPLQGWNRVTDHNIKGTITLRFERRNEACDIVISPTGFLNRTKIQAVIMPFSRSASDGPRRPVP